MTARGATIGSSYRPSDFSPAWWLPGAHLQTLGARLLRRRSGVPIGRERLDTPDGDFLHLDRPFPEDDDGAKPIVLVLHGLEGSARSKYALEVYRRLHHRGIVSVGLNFRSCSGVLNVMPRLYHSGDTGDLRFVLETLGERHPGRPIAAAGFSLGGNVLLKYLGEVGEDGLRRLAAAAAVSVPYDLSAGATHLERLGGRFYAGYLLKKLRRKVVAKARVMPPSVDVDRAAGARTFREFDDAATAPLHGFRDAEDYYRQSSSARFVSAIRVPTLLVHSQDDPFLPRAAIPRTALAENPNLTTAILPRGGHVGFVAASAPWRPSFWAEEEAARFLSSVIEDGRKTTTPEA